MNLDDLTDNERTALAAMAQHEANVWVRGGTSIPISYPECGRRALRWLEIAAMFNADYPPPRMGCRDSHQLGQPCGGNR